MERLARRGSVLSLAANPLHAGPKEPSSEVESLLHRSFALGHRYSAYLGSFWPSFAAILAQVSSVPSLCEALLAVFPMGLSVAIES